MLMLQQQLPNVITFPQHAVNTSIYNRPTLTDELTSFTFAIHFASMFNLLGSIQDFECQINKKHLET